MKSTAHPTKVTSLIAAHEVSSMSGYQPARTSRRRERSIQACGESRIPSAPIRWPIGPSTRSRKG